MNNQKLENLLNLALDADENERERSEILDVGYDPIEKEWELIVKYSGDRYDPPTGCGHDSAFE